MGRVYRTQHSISVHSGSFAMRREDIAKGFQMKKGSQIIKANQCFMFVKSRSTKKSIVFDDTIF